MTTKRVISSWRIMLRSRNSFILLFFLFLIIYTFIYYSSSSADDSNKEYSMIPENDTMVVCFENNEDKRRNQFDIQDSTTNSTKVLPIIYFVTPTYPRREQVAELTRLGQTLMHVPYLHWIVADDNEMCNRFLNNLLIQFGIPYTHIASPMPDIYRTRKTIPRGVANRRAALNWIRNNNKKSGILYFGDDDNTFDLKLFSEIRDTKRVSMFPVGLIGDYAVSSPIVTNGKVDGFFDSWPAKRKWPVDMAGFAVNLEFMSLSPNVTMPFKAGYEEDEFLKSIGLKLEHIEPKANNCTEVLVWHTQTSKSKAPKIKIPANSISTENFNLGILLKKLEKMGVNHISQTEGVKATITRDGKTKTISSWFS